MVWEHLHLTALGYRTAERGADPMCSELSVTVVLLVQDVQEEDAAVIGAFSRVVPLHCWYI